MSCSICDSIKNRENVVYEDKKIVAFLSKKPAAFGHVVIAPKQHYSIIENVPDYIVGDMFKIANKVSSAVFEIIGAEGTNILVNNGVDAGQKEPHVSVNVIPRRSNDNLGFNWAPKQLTEEEMSTVELILREGAKEIGGFQEEEKEIIETRENPEEDDNHDSYLLRQLDRVP